MIKTGDLFSHKFSYTQEDVRQFAEVTGDNNPIHLDEEYAANTMFKRPIMHGFLGASIFSKVFGTLFPGEGTIYMQQTMRFERPMFVDTEYEAQFEVTQHDAEKHRAKVSTKVVDTSSGKSVISGEAAVIEYR